MEFWKATGAHLEAAYWRYRLEAAWEAAWRLLRGFLDAAWSPPEGCLEAAWKPPVSHKEAAWSPPVSHLEAGGIPNTLLIIPLSILEPVILYWQL
ncbi:Phosphotriesterase-related protein [Frankliniella fusca]|uniref:Phosphotriesterase-related protein n=1 Tax=Frankliniella fusca TaxID=407009 RepID=A0AAE1GYF8_9NEOP|nr:Phosphotriesterase-related protein [Frankliniella fusca]